MGRGQDLQICLTRTTQKNNVTWNTDIIFKYVGWLEKYSENPQKAPGGLFCFLLGLIKKEGKNHTPWGFFRETPVSNDLHKCEHL